MLYKKEDFDNLFWNAFGNPKNVRTLWNTLNVYEEFQADLGGINEDLFFNYMEMVYHRDCVMVKDFDNTSDRKIRAFESLGEEKKKAGLFSVKVQEILDGKNKAANRMIIRFCALQHSQKWALLTVSSQSFDRLLFRMMDKSEEKDIEDAATETDKIQKTLNNMLKNMEALKKEIFMGDMTTAADSDEDFLSHARVPGFTERIVRGDIRIPTT